MGLTEQYTVHLIIQIPQLDSIGKQYAKQKMDIHYSNHYYIEKKNPTVLSGLITNTVHTNHCIGSNFAK